jgi:hypothetical protein
MYISDEATHCSPYDEGCTNPTSQLHGLEIVLSSHEQALATTNKGVREYHRVPPESTNADTPKS